MGGIPPAELRDLDEPERAAAAACLARYGRDVPARVEEMYTLKVLARKDLMPVRRVVAVRRARIADLAPFPLVFLGIPVLSLARQGARLLLEGGRLVAPLATERVVEVSEKGEEMVLYGRNLLPQSVSRARGRIAPGDDVILLAAATKRYLGIGVAESGLAGSGKGKKGPPDVSAVHHRLDLGLYLRAQQGTPQ